MIQFLLSLATTVLLLMEKEQLQLEAILFPITIIGGIGVIISLGFYIIKCVAVCKMAKKRGYKNWWLGMLPYANYYVIGKLVGSVRIFSLTIRNVGLIAMLASIAYDISSIGMMLAALQEIFNLSWIFTYFYSFLYSINTIVDLLFYICFFLLVYGIFGRYAPHKRTAYTIYCLLSQYLFGIQFMFPILLLVIMNNRPYASYDDYYKEQMAKRFGQTYNPFERPYSTSENPFNDSQGAQTGNKPQNEDPFDEYK